MVLPTSIVHADLITINLRAGKTNPFYKAHETCRKHMSTDKIENRSCALRTHCFFFSCSYATHCDSKVIQITKGDFYVGR